MKRYLIGAAAIGLLVAGCSSGEGGTAASGSTAPKAAPQSKSEQIAYVADSHPAFTASFTEHVCSDLGKYANESIVREHGEYLHNKAATGSSPEDAQWMVDQAIHIECPKYSSYAANRPAWQSEAEASQPPRSSGSVELLVNCGSTGSATVRTKYGVSEDNFTVYDGETLKKGYATTTELGDALIAVTVTPTAGYCSTVLTEGTGKILTRRDSMDPVEVSATVTGGA